MVSKDWPQIIPKVHIDKDTIILATKTDKQIKGTKKRPQNREHSCKDTIFWERVSAIYFRKKKSIFNKWFLENIPFWHIHMPKNEIISIFLNSKQTRFLYISWNIETCSWPWEAIWISVRKRVEYIWSLEDIKKCRKGQERDGR